MPARKAASWYRQQVGDLDRLAGARVDDVEGDPGEQPRGDPDEDQPIRKRAAGSGSRLPTLSTTSRKRFSAPFGGALTGGGVGLPPPGGDAGLRDSPPSAAPGGVSGSLMSRRG
jgi:hypothetical protein